MQSHVTWSSGHGYLPAYFSGAKRCKMIRRITQVETGRTRRLKDSTTLSLVSKLTATLEWSNSTRSCNKRTDGGGGL